MMKLYQKKNGSLEDETVLVQLERRHTLKEDTDEADSDNLRKAMRANSLGSLSESHSSTDIEAVTAEKASSLTRRPTVITESELASSRLYKDRKAKINSDDESIEEPRPTMPHEDHEDLEPRILRDPKLKPAPVLNQRSRKISSCCWYFTIALVIFFACLAVIAGVGGIVYMEYFAIYKDKDNANTSASGKNNNPSDSKKIFQHPTNKQDNFHKNEPKLPENILKDIIKNFTIPAEDTDVTKKITVAASQSSVTFHNKDLMGSNNSSKAKELTENKSSFGSENQDIEMTEHPKTAEHSDVSRNIHGRFNHFNVPISDKSLEIKSNLQNIDIMDKISDRHVDKVNEQISENGSMVTEKSNPKAEVMDSSEETFLSGRNFNFEEMATLQGIGLRNERVRADISFLNLPEHHIPPDDHDEDNSFDHSKTAIDHDSTDSSLDHTEHSIDHHPKDKSLDHRKHAADHDPKDNFLDHTKHAIDHDPKNNSFYHTEHSTDHSSIDTSLDHTEHSIDPNDKSLNDHSDDSSNFDSDDSSSEEHSLVDDQKQNSDDSSQLVFIRPIVESKAVPVPLAFLRRIGFDLKNPKSLQSITANDMDIKFSLAEALKYLRSLDTDGKLPVSREKTITPKKSKKESKETKLPIKSERKEYLNLLRKQIFEKSS